MSSLPKSATGKWSDLERRAFSLLVWMGSSWVCFAALKDHGYDGPWLPIQKVMHFASDPPIRYRILFPLVANAIQFLFPTFSDLKCFLLSQLVAILLAFHAAKRWAGLFLPREWTFVSQLLLASLLVPTIRYFTFYDFGIVFFFTASLYCIFTGSFRSYLVLLALGTLNHEITLLLIPVFVVVHFEAKGFRARYWLRVLLQLAVYGAVRISSILLLSSDPGGVERSGSIIESVGAGAENRIAINLDLLLHQTSPLLHRYVPLVFWYGLSLLGIRYATRPLRRSLILFPLLVGSTFIYGQFNEIRHFDPFLPVLMALIFCLLSSLLQRGEAASADAAHEKVPDPTFHPS